MLKRLLAVFMIPIIAFSMVFVIPQQQTANAMVPIVMKEGAERLGKAVLKKFGYKIARTDKAQEIGEIMISKMSKEGADNFFDALNKAQRIDKTSGKWVKAILPTALTAEIAGILLTMTGDVGKDVMVGEPSTLEEEAKPLDAPYEPEELGTIENGKITGITFPLLLVPSDLTTDFLGFNMTKKLTYSNTVYNQYTFATTTPFGFSESVASLNVYHGDADLTKPFNHMGIEIKESFSSSRGYEYTIVLMFFNDKTQRTESRNFNVYGGTMKDYSDLSLAMLVGWLREIGYSNTQIVEVPQMPLHPDMPTITPSNVPKEPLEIAFPSDYGYQEIFQNDPQKYQDTLNKADITNNTYITNVYEKSGYPSDPVPYTDPNTGITTYPEPDPLTVPVNDPIKQQVPISSPTGDPYISDNPTSDPTSDPTGDNTTGGEPTGGEPTGSGNDTPPDDEDLNLEPLKNVGTMFTERFPFSLPWDIMRAIDSMAGEKVEPKFTIKLPKGNGQYVTYEIGLPEAMKEYIPFARGGFVAIFLIGLIYGTRQLMGGSV